MTDGTNGNRVPEDLALIAARLGAGLREAGVPADPARGERFARAVLLARPATRHELYLCALATFASGPEQTGIVQRVFRDLFGGQAAAAPARPGRICPARRPGHPRTTCWPRRPGPRRTTRPRPRDRRRVLTERTARTRRTALAAPSRERPATPRSQARRTSRRAPARPWPAGRNGWRAPTSPS